MSHALERLAAQRFVVFRKDLAISVRGALTGDIDFSRYTELFTGAEVISVAEVPFASWVGLEKFLDFLLGVAPQAVFSDVQAGAMAALSCMRAARGGHPNVSSFDVPVYVVETQKRLNKRMAIADIVERLCGAPRPKEDYRALCAVEFLVGDLLEASGGVVMPDLRKEGRANKDAFGFVLASFHQTIIELSRAQVAGMAIAALTTVGDLLTKLEHGHRFLEGKGKGGGQVPDRPALVGEVASKHQDILDGLAGLSPLLDRVLLVHQAAARGFPDLDGFTPTGCEPALRATEEGMKAIASRMDAFGVEVFGLIAQLSVGGELFARAAALLEEEAMATEEARAELNDAFFVVDCFAAESKETTLAEVKKECDTIDGAVMNLMIEMQGFDSIRQVIEKRAKEIGRWIELLPTAAAGDMDAFTNGILDVIAGKLVTEPERQAFALYFGAMRTANTDSVDGGEINFF